MDKSINSFGSHNKSRNINETSEINKTNDSINEASMISKTRKSKLMLQRDRKNKEIWV